MSNQPVTAQRIEYLDVAKCIGILCIHLGHYNEGVSWLYPLVWQFHVPLFFFLAGCSETLAHDKPFKTYFMGKVKRLLLPWAVFAVFYLVIQSIDKTYDLYTTVGYLTGIFKGCIRNTYDPAHALWFLTCLFCMSILFFFLKKLNKWYFILAVAFVAAWLTGTMIPVIPSLPWNFDGALYYLPLYALGYVCFPLIKRLFNGGGIPVLVVGVLCLGYTACQYYGKDMMYPLGAIPGVAVLLPIFRALPSILGIMVVSQYASRCSLLARMGRESLYLCCNETLMVLLFNGAISCMGLKFEPAGPLSIVILASFLMYLSYRFVVPVEKQAIAWFEKRVFPR